MLKSVSEERMGEVPETLREAVKYLNDLLSRDRQAVSYLLDQTSTEVGPLVADHPSLYLRVDPNGASRLSSLGILGGLVNSDRFRLCAWFSTPYSEGDLIEGFEVVELVEEG